MKLVISIAGDSLQSPFDARFGRAAAFCLVDSDTGDWTVHANPALEAAGGAGVQAAQCVAGLGAQAVVSGAYGPKAFASLSAAGIAMHLAPGNAPRTGADVLAQFKAGALSRAQAATQDGRH
jgi:predicted Fe-Mo cluster-binding NifX family protein